MGVNRLYKHSVIGIFMGRNLINLLFGLGLLTLINLDGCGKPESDLVRKEKEQIAEQKKDIRMHGVRPIYGFVEAINRGAFPCAIEESVGFGIGVGSSTFQYEVLGIDTKAGMKYKILFPQHTGYGVGDVFDENVLLINNFTFSQLVKKYSLFDKPLQSGFVSVSGIVDPKHRINNSQFIDKRILELMKDSEKLRRIIESSDSLVLNLYARQANSLSGVSYVSLIKYLDEESLREVGNSKDLSDLLD